MKARSLAIVVVVTAAVAVGCNRNRGVSTVSTGALDITPPTPVYSQPQPVAASPAPVAQPVYDSAPAFASQTPVSQGFSDGGARYTVQKGDTLFSIAKNRYGNGNQWQRIAAANPGLTPQNLKAGQTITIPN